MPGHPLVQLWRALPGFRGEAQASTWLYRVALNTAFGFVRTRSTRPEASLDIADLELEQDRFPAPDERLDATQDLHRLHAAIDLLDELEKALVTLYLDDRSYQEIARFWGSARAMWA